MWSNDAVSFPPPVILARKELVRLRLNVPSKAHIESVTLMSSFVKHLQEPLSRIIAAKNFFAGVVYRHLEGRHRHAVPNACRIFFFDDTTFLALVGLIDGRAGLAGLTNREASPYRYSK
jgi:hypothetical protein